MNNLKDTLYQINVVDSIKVNDTVKSIKLVPLGPSKKISSENGAIIPKQVLQMIKLEPAKTIKKEEGANLAFYSLIGLGVLVLIFFFKVLKRKSKVRRG